MKKETPAEAMRRLRTKLQVEAADIALDALMAVAANESAPAPARATAGTSIFRAVGLFERGESGSGEKEPHAMTAEEIDAAIRKIKEAVAARTPDDDEESSGVFG